MEKLAANDQGPTVKAANLISQNAPSTDVRSLTAERKTNLPSPPQTGRGSSGGEVPTLRLLRRTVTPWPDSIVDLARTPGAANSATTQQNQLLPSPPQPGRGSRGGEIGRAHV